MIGRDRHRHLRRRRAGRTAPASAAPGGRGVILGKSGRRQQGRGGEQQGFHAHGGL
jgi:hypothetical protein